MSSGKPLFYPQHMHMRHWTLGLVRRGVVVLESSAGTRRMDTGGFFVVPPRMPHSLRITGHSELLALSFAEECLPQHMRDSFSSLCSFLVPQEYELVEQIIDQYIRQDCSLEERWTWGEMRRLVQRLVAQPEETLSVPEMARIACISPWYFLRRFQLATGMTPHAFLLNCKIRRLRSLLRGRVAAVSAAAHTGFTDQSHMHKLFKLHHNLTPRQFVLASSNLDDANY